MRRIASLFLAATTAAAAVSLVDAAEPEEVRIARLVEQLGSDDFASRQQAGQQLARLGRDGEQHLSTALRDSDPEVQLRAARLLKRLQLNRLWGPSVVDHTVADRPLTEVLGELGAQTGNEVLVGEGYGNFNDAKVSLRAAGDTFWETLDNLCRQTDNHVRPHYNPRQPGLVLVSGGIGQNPVTYSGPVRAQLTSARRVFIEQFDYETAQSEITHTFQINLQIMWEDRFRLVAYRSQPELTAAITDTGAALQATQPGSSGWNVAGSGIRQLTASLRLHPPPAAARKLDELKLSWGLIAVGDMTTLDMPNPSDGARFHRDDVEVVVDSVEERPGGRFVYSVLISRDLIVPEPPEVLLHENTLELFDAQGRAFGIQGQTNLLTDRGAQMKITFQAPEPEAKPNLMRMTYPRIRDQRNLEIIFRDVPLPVAQPK